MEEMLEISVIIPVFNAERFINQAVNSCLMQPQVRQVILIEDKSLDESLIVCRRLAQADTRIRLLRSPGELNAGAAASRNAGLRVATTPFVAFLDADDFFLPNRFQATEKVFLAHGDAEGVYEACGYHFESEELERQWSAHIDATRLTTMRYAVDPRSLFYSQAPIGRFGYAHTNGWTVRLSVFHKTGFFNESLELHQDTDLYVKFAVVCRMYPGNLTSAVSMRRVHAHNRISAVRTRDAAFRHKVKMWWSICSWLTHHGTKKQAFVALQRFANYIISYRWNSSTAKSRFSAQKIRTVYEICPSIFMQKRFYLAAATSVAVALLRFLKRSVTPAVPL